MSSIQTQDFYSVIVSAQQNDCQTNYGKAFVLYLDGIHGLTDYLKSRANDSLDTIGTQNMDHKLVSGIRTLKNCVERLEMIANCGQQHDHHNNNNNNESDLNESEDNLVTKLSHQSIDESFDSVDGVSTGGPLDTSLDDSRVESNGLDVSPKTSPNLQKAYKENTFLRRIFERRLRSTIDPLKRASLKLELQRRFIENMEIAKSKDKELYHSMHLAQRKSLEAAAKKLVQQQSVLNLNNESMIVDNQSQQQLYAQILDFESKNLDLSQQFRCASLDIDRNVVNEIITKILGIRDHPLSQWIHKFQTQIVHIINPLLRQYLRRRTNAQNSDESDSQSLQSFSSYDVLEDMNIEVSDVESEALIRHFENISKDIALSHETITLMMTLILFDNQLYYKPSNNDVLREQHSSIHSIVSQFIYPPIWSAFKFLFRIVFHKLEMRLRKGINHLLVTKELNKDLSDEYNSSVMEEAAESLRLLLQLRSPFEKLKSMVRLTQDLCAKLKSDCEHSSEVSADDLIPALCEVVLRCGCHQLISEFTAIEQLVDQKYLLGEEGYCLSSILTALKYIEMHSCVDFSPTPPEDDVNE